MYYSFIYYQFLGPAGNANNNHNVSRPEQEIFNRKSNVFDSIKKPPSVTMEKIQSTTAAALDRMAILQQRYRQHKEAMSSDTASEISRRPSSVSTLENNVST